MTNVTTIPLNKLACSKRNVRKTKGCDTALAELAASISAHGLLQSLVVAKDKRGKFAVIAGARRLAALNQLASEGRIETKMEVPCILLDERADVTEVSLAENVAREPMHPADEFDAFRALIDAGMSIADVAARFGLAESTVEKRLRLARVSPVILDAYRKDELGLEQVMAFAVTDDIQAQERLWSDGPEWLRDNARSIRAALTEHETAATDKRVQFVTLKAYEKAGGGLRRDLFSEGETGVFILDVALLESLVQKKLEKVAKAVRKEGWKWVEIQPSLEYGETAQFERRYPETTPLSPDEESELAAIEKEIDDSYNVEGDLTAEHQTRIDEITLRMEDLTDNREEFWPAETLEVAGAIVSVGYGGEAEITRGLVKPEDGAVKSKRASKSASGDGPKVGAVNGLPSALTESLTAERSVALSAAMIESPEVGLAAVVHALALSVFHHHREDTSIRIEIDTPALLMAEGSKASLAIEEKRKQWLEVLPADPGDLWAWCLKQLPETLMQLMAFCAAVAIDAQETRKAPTNSRRLAHANALASTLEFDMAAWFKPTAENYFSRVTKSQILIALQEAKGNPPAPAWMSLKKPELAALAEREIADKGWLPEVLRTPELQTA